MSHDLATLRHEDFAQHVHECFALHTGEAPLELVLAEVRPWNSPEIAEDFEQGRRKRIPFRMTFRGPLLPELPQRIYRVENETFGSMEVFLVPVARRDGAMWYEAVFT